MTRFAEKFAVESPRLKNWDYSTPGIYFITICTVHHNNFFGKIINNQMELSKMGIIAKNCLIDIPKHFLNIIIDEYVVMPNHVHLLINFLDNHVETHDRASLQKQYQSYYFHRLAIKSNQTISKVMSQFKSSVTRLINPKTVFFGWQPGFYDQIIKSKEEYFVIKKYVQNNVVDWKKDKFCN